MANKLRLEGKVAIVTGGANGGIGEATARLFVEHGARVVIAGTNDERGHQVVTSIGTDKASFHRCDVTDEKQVEELVAFAVDKYGTLDIMFSNAGTVGEFGSLLDMDMADFDRVMAVNTRGPALTLKHAAKVMVDKKVRGSIIFSCSLEATLAGTAPLAYVASKTAVLGVMKGGARELGQYGIRVNSVSPYGITTPMICKEYHLNMDLLTHINDAIQSSGNLKAFALSTKHVAEAVLFLASDESAYVSGHNLAVDGGLSSVLKLS